MPSSLSDLLGSHDLEVVEGERILWIWWLWSGICKCPARNTYGDIININKRSERAGVSEP